MPQSTPILTDFSMGEISPRFEGRVDTKNYYKSCLRLENFINHTQGGSDCRPGSYFITNGKTNTHRVRLIPFELATGNYVLELGNLYMRVLLNGSQIQDGGPVEDTTPWAIADLFEIQYRQTTDTLYLVHPSYDVTQITRVSDTDWTVADVTFTGADPPNFNSADNRPGCIAIFEQRLWLAGSNNNPNRIWGSKSGDLVDFNSTDRLQFDVYHNRRIRIKWLAEKNEIAFGTGRCEGVLTGNKAPLSETNYQLGIQSPYGSAAIQGKVVGNKVLFVQKGKRRIREYGYSDEQHNWFSPDLTTFSEEISESGFTEFDIQTNPDTIVWFVRTDGEMATLSYEKDYGIMGWQRQVTDGIFESIAIVPGSDDTKEDLIYVSVKRTINGTTKRFIEYFKPRNFGSEQKNYFGVDCGITFDGGVAKNITGATSSDPVVVTSTSHGFENDQLVRIRDVVGMTEINDKVFMVKNKSTNIFELYEKDGSDGIDGSEYTAYTSGGTVQRVITTMTGLTHLEGKTLDVCVEGAAHPQEIVSTGEIDLDYAGNLVHAGLPYKSYLKPMKIEAPGARGTGQGQQKRIIKLWARVYKSLGLKAGPDENNLKDTVFRDIDDPTDTPPPLFSGDKRIQWPGGSSIEGDILIVQDQPLPLNLVALIIRADVQDE